MKICGIRLAGVALAAVLIGGCNSAAEVTSSAPAMSLSFGTTTFSVKRGETKTYPGTITRTGGFTGSVSVSVTGLPAELSVGCSPSLILGHETTLTVTADETSAVGTFTATIRATAAGVQTQTIIATIDVTS